MKILVLQGSPRTNGHTATRVAAFVEGAREAAHDVDVVDVAHMEINGCTACEYCHTKGNGTCIQKDDMAKVYPLYDSADMIVIASPVYYGSLSGQLTCAINRTYAIGVPAACKKMALILASGASGVFRASETIYHGFLQGWYGVEDCGVFEGAGSAAVSDAALDELRAFGRSL